MNQGEKDMLYELHLLFK